MTYPFVQAANDYGLRKGPFLAFVVHMAEGGGTVGFLSRPNLRGVSVHYVIEYSGRIVQMLLESHASGSINPKELRSTDGPEPYGATVRKTVMGDWDHDPNSAVISLEIEGFAKDGPNAKQAASLVELVDDVRSRHPSIGLLGHRDFTSTKACPGAHIDWPALGGHGPAKEVDTVGPLWEPSGSADGTVTITADGGHMIDVQTGAPTPVAKGFVRNVYAAITMLDGDYKGQPAWLATYVDRAVIVMGFLGTHKPATVPPAPPADCTTEVAAAIVADRKKAHIVYG